VRQRRAFGQHLESLDRVAELFDPKDARECVVQLGLLAFKHSAQFVVGQDRPELLQRPLPAQVLDAVNSRLTRYLRPHCA